MLLNLKEDSRYPRGRQIVFQIRGLIQEGHLKPGECLPSTRRLGEQLGLHRSTVAEAYHELWALGWVDLRPGALPRVRRRGALVAQAPQRPEAFPWAERLAQPLLHQEGPVAIPEGTISFANLGLDPRLMPLEPFARSMKAVLRRQGARLLDYGESQGLASFRECLSHRMGQHGVLAAPEEVLVTQGAQHALDLVLRGLTRPGDSILVESPTYDQMLKLLALHQVRPLAIPTGDEGLDLPALEALIQKERPALLYTMPSFQNPTGRCLSQAQREGLLALGERMSLPILEDGFEEEMKYFGRPMLPLKSMDRSGLVLYAGTFSKALFPGLRLGWLAGSRTCIDALTALRKATDLCPPPLLQAALEDFIQKGHLDQHLARLHRTFRRRMDTCLTALRRELDPKQVSWDPPTGGYLIWLELENLPAFLDLETELLSYGIRVRKGSRFYPDGQVHRPFIRLSISNLDEAEITEGIARLGRGLRALA